MDKDNTTSLKEIAPTFLDNDVSNILKSFTIHTPGVRRRLTKYNLEQSNMVTHMTESDYEKLDAADALRYNLYSPEVAPLVQRTNTPTAFYDNLVANLQYNFVDNKYISARQAKAASTYNRFIMAQRGKISDPMLATGFDLETINIKNAYGQQTHGMIYEYSFSYNVSSQSSTI